MLSIGLNAQLLTSEHGYRGAGISSYIWRLLQGLAHCETDHTFTIFHAQGVLPTLPDWPATMHAQPTRWPMRHAPTRMLWEAVALPHAARHMALLHAPVNTLPQHLACPGVVTVHDLAFLRFPAVVTPLRRRYLTYAVGGSVRRAAKVIAVSASTRRDIIEQWGIAPDRVQVVYPAIDPAMRPITDTAVLTAFAAEHDLLRPYILFLGTLEPRKNLLTLIEAFALARAHGMRNHQLVLAGAQDWQGGQHADLLRARIQQRGIADWVRLPGYVVDEQRALWYNGATVVVLPSWYEGFGFPAAEALACGVPVIAANAGSLPEVVEPLGMLCDPADVDDWADALCYAAEAGDWRRHCQQGADEYHLRFTESAMAIATLSVYDSVIQPQKEGTLVRQVV